MFKAYLSLKLINIIKIMNSSKISKDNTTVVQINSIEDLMKIPYSKLAKTNLQFYQGEYYEKILKELIYPLEKKKIKEINPTQPWIKPSIKNIIFKINFDTVFGQSLKITGSSSYLGNWSEHKNLTFDNGAWIFKVQLNEDMNSDLSFEYKYILNSHGSDIWESIHNRTFNLQKNLDIIENLINSSLTTSSTSSSKSNEESCKYFLETTTCVFKASINTLIITSVWNS